MEYKSINPDEIAVALLANRARQEAVDALAAGCEAERLEKVIAMVPEEEAFEFRAQALAARASADNTVKIAAISQAQANVPKKELDEAKRTWLTEWRDNAERDYASNVAMKALREQQAEVVEGAANKQMLDFAAQAAKQMALCEAAAQVADEELAKLSGLNLVQLPDPI